MSVGYGLHTVERRRRSWRGEPRGGPRYDELAVRYEATVHVAAIND